MFLKNKNKKHILKSINKTFLARIQQDRQKHPNQGSHFNYIIIIGLLGMH